MASIHLRVSSSCPATPRPLPRPLPLPLPLPLMEARQLVNQKGGVKVKKKRGGVNATFPSNNALIDILRRVAWRLLLGVTIPVKGTE